MTVVGVLLCHCLVLPHSNLFLVAEYLTSIGFTPPTNHGHIHRRQLISSCIDPAETATVT